MKLPFAKIEGLLKNPDKQYRVWLVYGPDQGLVGERGKTIGRHAVADLNDPFNVATLTGAQILDDPVRLNDEAFAQSLMGGDRLVRILDAGDSIAPLIKDYLKDPSPYTLVTIEAGELGTKSALRALIEKAPNAVTIPCYVEDERDLTRIVADACKAENLAIDRDALAALASSLVGDRSVARGELEKLFVYKLNDPDRVVHMADVIACSGDARARTMDELIQAFGLGDAVRMQASIKTLLEENTAPVAILRAVQNHIRRLVTVQISVQEDGISVEQAMKSLNPPVFFKFEQGFMQQLRNWPLARLCAASDKLNKIEARTKQTGIPAEILTAHALMEISLNLPSAA